MYATRFMQQTRVRTGIERLVARILALLLNNAGAYAKINGTNPAFKHRVKSCHDPESLLSIKRFHCTQFCRSKDRLSMGQS